MLYLWVKAFHIIAVIAWMVGLLYLPRLFAYHATAEMGSATSETFKVMERRLLRVIMNPAMIATWLLGAVLLYLQPDWLHQEWFHGKALLVLILTIFHMFLARWRRLFAEDRNPHTARFYRSINEVPTVLLIGIVLLVILKPF